MDPLIKNNQVYVIVQFNINPTLTHCYQNYTFKIKKSFMIAFVIDCANHRMKGTAANQVKMKLKGSGICT